IDSARGRPSALTLRKLFARHKESCTRLGARRARHFRARADQQGKVRHRCQDRSATRRRLVVDLRFHDKAEEDLSSRDRCGLSKTRGLLRSRQQTPAISRSPTTSILREADELRPEIFSAAQLPPRAHSANGLAARSQSKVLLLASSLNSTLGRSPNEFVHLELETDSEFVSQNPFHDLARIDPAEDW